MIRMTNREVVICGTIVPRAAVLPATHYTETTIPSRTMIAISLFLVFIHIFNIKS
jgi:hypothetical protein